MGRRLACTEEQNAMFLRRARRRRCAHRRARCIPALAGLLVGLLAAADGRHGDPPAHRPARRLTVAVKGEGARPRGEAREARGEDVVVVAEEVAHGHAEHAVAVGGQGAGPFADAALGDARLQSRQHHAGVELPVRHGLPVARAVVAPAHRLA